MVTEEQLVIERLQKALIYPIIMDQLQRFYEKHKVVPDVIGLNAYCLEALQKELDAFKGGGQRVWAANANSWNRAIAVMYNGQLVPVVPFIATKKQLKAAPDMEWLFIKHEARNLVETL